MLKIFLQRNRLEGKFPQLYSNISITLTEPGVNGLKRKFIEQLFLITKLQKSWCKKNSHKLLAAYNKMYSHICSLSFICWSAIHLLTQIQVAGATTISDLPNDDDRGKKGSTVLHHELRTPTGI